MRKSDMEIKLVDKEKILELQLPAYTEIPDVGLYLKQVVKYINESLGKDFGYTVTDTMLSNYVKMHIVPNPEKKMYYREHIATFLFISMAKTVLSLDNINILLDLARSKYGVKASYNFYKDHFEATLISLINGESVPLLPHPGASDEQILLNNIAITLSYKFLLDTSIANSNKERILL